MYLSVCLSVRLSHPAAARRCCGFAAVGPAGRRYRSIAARPAVSSSGAARRNADSAELSVNLVNIFNGIMRRNRYGACLATVNVHGHVRQYRLHSSRASWNCVKARRRAVERDERPDFVTTEQKNEKYCRVQSFKTHKTLAKSDWNQTPKTYDAVQSAAACRT